MSRWSKKDYEMVAATLKNRATLHAEHGKKHYFRELAGDFADTFGNDSEKFNRALFLKACGVTE